MSLSPSFETSFRKTWNSFLISCSNVHTEVKKSRRLVWTCNRRKKCLQFIPLQTSEVHGTNFQSYILKKISSVFLSLRPDDVGLIFQHTLRKLWLIKLNGGQLFSIQPPPQFERKYLDPSPGLFPGPSAMSSVLTPLPMTTVHFLVVHCYNSFVTFISTLNDLTLGSDRNTPRLI